MHSQDSDQPGLAQADQSLRLAHTPLLVLSCHGSYIYKPKLFSELLCFFLYHDLFTIPSTESVSCIYLDCGGIGDPNGVLDGSSLYGGTPTISCNIGYTGGGTITCLPSGLWDKSLATTCVLFGKYLILQCNAHTKCLI